LRVVQLLLGRLLRLLRRHLRAAWEDWTADAARLAIDIPGIGPVEQWREVTDVSLPLVSFRHTYRFMVDGTVVTSDSPLRFRGRDEVEASLTAAGCRVRDVRDAPDRPGREFAFIAERTGYEAGTSA